MEAQKKLSLPIDLRLNTMIPLPQFIQNDTNILEFTVKDNGVDADLSNITRIVVNYKRLDKKVISRLLTATGNTVLYEVGLEEMEVPGPGELELQFYENEKRISTKRFKVNMLASIGTDAIYENTEQMTVLQELFVEVDTVKVETETARNNADAATEAANTAAANAQQVADENKTRFLPAVASVADRNSAYPAPAHGDTVRVTGESKTYRYDSVSGWVVTDQYNPTAIDKLNADLAQSVQQLKEIENLSQVDYASILEQNFSDLVEGRLVTKPNSVQKNVAKTGTVANGEVSIDGTHSNITRIHSVKDGANELFENVDYTVDLIAGKIKFPFTYSVSRYEETTFTFGTGWTDYTHASLSGGADKYIKESTAIANPSHGATLTASFTTFYFVTRKGNTEGIAKITIDGVVYEVDCYDPASALYQQKILVVDGLPNTPHNVKIEHSGKHNPLSTGNLTVHFDAVEYGVRQSSSFDGKLLNYKIDTISYQGQLSGIGTIEGEDKFRFKVLHSPDYAYLITDKSRVKPFPNASSVVFTGSDFKKVKYDTTNNGYSKITEGQKYFVKSSSAGTNATFGTTELENGINPTIQESYGMLQAPQPRMIAKPVLIVVTDKCRSDFEVGEIAMAIFTDVRNDLTMEINTPGMNVFKINQKLKMKMVNIVAYGDSITACTYLKNYQSYSEQLEILLKKAVDKNINVINKGDNGDKTTDLITTMYQVTEQDPDYVIIATGTNDQGYAVSTTDYRTNLITMINEFQNIGAKVILMNMPKVDYPTHYNTDRNTAFAPYIQVLSNLSSELNLPYVDYHSRFGLEITNGNWDLFYHNDGTGGYALVDPRTDYAGFFKNIHPNAYGQAIIAEEIAKVMIPILE